MSAEAVRAARPIFSDAKEMINYTGNSEILNRDNEAYAQKAILATKMLMMMTMHQVSPETVFGGGLGLLLLLRMKIEMKRLFEPTLPLRLLAMAR